MMSSENIPPPSQPPDNHQTTTARKAAPPQKPSQEQQQQQQQQAPLKCPRCDSSNTKFCYYNNYSLTQPRHFCKTCRRYWTKGGALRNVPIGGGCRKAKRHKPSPSSSCPTPSVSLSAGPGGAEFRFLTPSTVAPAMDFQLGGISLPRLHPATAGVYTQFVTSSGAHPQSAGVGPGPGGCFSLDLLGMGNYPPIPNPRSSPSSNSSSLTLVGGGAAAIGGDHTISSIESLSSINQEMHWKLQQQRLAMIYGGPSPVEQDDNQQQQEKSLLGGGGGGGINLFKNLECTNKKVVDVTPTEWLFDQIHSNSSANYDNENHNIAINNNHHNNNHQDFNGVWTTELHHHHHHFNGLQ